MKYQMRGLGVGIIVTALLMGVATGKGIPLSDAEIRAKALELGMVERDSLKLTDLEDVFQASAGTSSPEESAGADQEASGGAGLESDEPDEAGDSTAADASGEAGTASGEDGAAGSGDSSEEGSSSGEDGTSGLDDSVRQDSSTGEGDAVRIVIEYGVTSDHVSQMLEEAGLVEDAASFDSYLCNNGFSRNITAGVYEIAPGTSEEEIVEMITKNR